MDRCLEIESAVGMKWTTFLNLLTEVKENRRKPLAEQFVLETDDTARLLRRRG